LWAVLCHAVIRKVIENVFQLGGKNAGIIFADADFSKCIPTTIRLVNIHMRSTQLMLYRCRETMRRCALRFARLSSHSLSHHSALEYKSARPQKFKLALVGLHRFQIDQGQDDEAPRDSLSIKRAQLMGAVVKLQRLRIIVLVIENVIVILECSYRH